MFLTVPVDGAMRGPGGDFGRQGKSPAIGWVQAVDAAWILRHRASRPCWRLSQKLQRIQCRERHRLLRARPGPSRQARALRAPFGFAPLALRSGALTGRPRPG